MNLQLPALVYGNAVRGWITAAIVFGAVLVLLIGVRLFLLRRLAAAKTQPRGSIRRLVFDLVHRTRYAFLIVLALAAASVALAVTPRAAVWIRDITSTVVVLQIAYWMSGVLTFWVDRLEIRRAHAQGSRMTMDFLRFAMRVLLWTLVFLLVFENLGYHVTALWTTLGVGGVAIAFAVQNTLGDLLAGLVILLDRPFDLGDSIGIDQIEGTVEHIGARSTHVRSLTGEQIILGNQDILKARIKNYKRQSQRLVTFSLGVVYQTSPEQVARIPQLAREVITAQKRVRFERAHLKGFGDSALLFEVVYTVLTADYTAYMDVQQAIYLGLFRRLEGEKIGLAYPTRTVFIAGDERGGEGDRPADGAGREARAADHDGQHSQGADQPDRTGSA